jgi:primosomal protein N' (replication factor Y)
MAQKITAWIEQGDHRGTEIIGPVPCFFSRQNALYRWQIILRGPDPVSVLRGRALEDWRVEVDPVSLL